MENKHEIARFNARDESGKDYVVVKFQHYTSRKLSSGETINIKDGVEFALENGNDLKILEETFEVVSTGQIIRKV